MESDLAKEGRQLLADLAHETAHGSSGTRAGIYLRIISSWMPKALEALESAQAKTQIASPPPGGGGP